MYGKTSIALGDLDKEVQKYIRALRAASTAISVAVPLVLAAAQGIIKAKDGTLPVDPALSLLKSSNRH